MEETRFDLVHAEDPSRVIRGRVCAPGAQTSRGPWAMLLHGFKGYMDWAFFPLLARGLAEGGITTIRFNNSGSGVGDDLEYYSDPTAFENDTYSRQLEDYALVRQAIDEGEFGPLDPAQGVLIGHSRGGGMGLIHAAEHDYRGVITWSAISDGAFFDDKVVERWRADGHLEIPNTRTGHIMRIGLDAVHDFEANRERLDILAAAARLQAPTLVLHGSDDETVPVLSAHHIAKALPNGQLHVIDGANHTYQAKHPLEDVPPQLGQALALTLQHASQSVGLAL